MNAQLNPIQSDAGAKSNIKRVCAASCRKILEQIENLKTRIVSEFREGLAQDQHVLELAVNEAEALAWQSGFPQLFFPALALEKAHAISNWYARQQSLRRNPIRSWLHDARGTQKSKNKSNVVVPKTFVHSS